MKYYRILILILILAMIFSSCGLQEEMSHEYAEDFARDGELLAEISEKGIDNVEYEWLLDWLRHYQIQSDGHGLAIVLHPLGADASGTSYTVMYETTDGGKNWNVLHELFTYPKGMRVFVYMGEAAVLAGNHDKGVGSSLIISDDRGRTWSDTMYLDDLIDYDMTLFPSLEPHVINYNCDNGIITFGWKEGFFSQSEYLLINQFDVNTCRFVEEIYRHPDFPGAPETM